MNRNKLKNIHLILLFSLLQPSRWEVFGYVLVKQTQKKARPVGPRVTEIFMDCGRVYEICWKYINILSKQTKYCQNKYIKDKYVISRLIIIIIVEFEHYCGPFFFKTTAEILYYQGLGRGNKTVFSMSVTTPLHHRGIMGVDTKFQISNLSDKVMTKA